MTDMPSTPDAEIIRDTALEAAKPIEVDPQNLYVAPSYNRGQVVDLEQYLEKPRRARGVVQPATVDSLIEYVSQHEEVDATTVWVDRASLRVVAVLNDHDTEDPGWGDHRAELALELSPEWRRWAALDGQQVDQLRFAEHIEDSLLDIADPPAADLLEVAQSIEATTTASFRSAHRLHNGAVGFVYDEQIDAKAGESGQLEIPREFKLALAPFVGEDPRELTARLRYRIASNRLTIGYRLDRPDEVIRDAVQAIADRLDEQFRRVYLGTPRSA